MNKLPKKFSFKFTDSSEYVNIAEKRDYSNYDIVWDERYVAGGNVTWFECSLLEIYEFLNEENGWVIIEELEKK